LELNYRITTGLFWALFCGLTFLAFCSDLFQNETGLVKGLDSQALLFISEAELLLIPEAALLLISAAALLLISEAALRKCPCPGPGARRKPYCCWSWKGAALLLISEAALLLVLEAAGYC
jgi:hypothetical protein